MSVTTVQIPAEHVTSIREGLLSRRDQLEVAALGTEAGEVEELIEQLGVGDSAAIGSREVTGSRDALWTAVYDAVCAAAERLADECNEYWRGAIAPAHTKAAIDQLRRRFELLESLGPPPTG
jgi:hypothetical protein